MISLPRRLVLLALFGVIVACVAGVLASGQQTRAQVLGALTRSSLDELALLAGVVDDAGQLQREAAMPLEVVAEGGSVWALETVRASVEANPNFSVDASSHILRSEIVEAPGGIAVQLHLWRAGWELREPEPRRARVAPWAAILGGVLGAIAALFSGRLSIGLATSGVLAQLALNFDPLPRGLFPSQTLAQAWASGPLAQRGMAWIRGMGSAELAVLVGLLTVSLILVAFDHRRSRGEVQDLGLGGASLTAGLGFIGALCWLEAASRGALLAACDLRYGAFLGLVAFGGLILAWLPAIRVARDSWRV